MTNSVFATPEPETSVFAVMRGSTVHSCLGSDLDSKTTDTDIVTVQRGADLKKVDIANLDKIQDTDLLVCTDINGRTCTVTGALFKPLFAGPPPPPIPLLTPIITGQSLVGDTLTITNFTTSQGPVAYKWYRDGTEIGGETGVNYVCKTVDLYKDISARYTAGGDLSDESNKVTVANVSVSSQSARLFITTDSTDCSPKYSSYGVTVDVPVYVGDINLISNVRYTVYVNPADGSAGTSRALGINNRAFHIDNRKNNGCKQASPYIAMTTDDQVYFITSWTENGVPVSAPPSTVVTYRYHSNHDPSKLP